jgi:hypothetical protein
LTVTTSATFVCLLVGTTAYAIGSGVTLIAAVSGAIIGINFMPVTIVYIESDPATLPSPEKVEAGEIYGYTGIELTGTGLIVDPAVLAAALVASQPAGFKRAIESIAFGTVDAGSTTTSVVSSACTPAGAVADQYKHKVLTFAADTATAALRGVSCAISASSNAAAPTFTVSTLPAAPASGDTFTIG